MPLKIYTLWSQKSRKFKAKGETNTSISPHYWIIPSWPISHTQISLWPSFCSASTLHSVSHAGISLLPNYAQGIADCYPPCSCSYSVGCWSMQNNQNYCITTGCCCKVHAQEITYHKTALYKLFHNTQLQYLLCLAFR